MTSPQYQPVMTTEESEQTAPTSEPGAETHAQHPAEGEPSPPHPGGFCCVSVKVSSLLRTFGGYLCADRWYLLFTMFIVLLIGTISFLFKVDKFKVQAFRSFDIEDPTLNYRHKPSTIPGPVNIIITTAFAVVVSVLGNLCTSLGCKMNCKRGCCNSKSPLSVEKVQIKEESKLCHVKGKAVTRLRMYRVIWSLLFLLLALAENNMLTNFTKTMMGTLKPHFLRECRPNTQLLHGGTWVNETLTKDICVNNENFDYRRAFPSGHVSQASVCVVYAILEIHSIPNVILARLIQLTGLIYWVVTCCLRITGHHHHWYEVLGGAILGAVIALSSYPMKEIQIRRQFKTENQKIYENLVKPSDMECGQVACSSKETHKEEETKM